MLINIETGKRMENIPTSRKPEYDLWTSRMTLDEIETIREELNSMIDGTEIQTSSWMPGTYWEDTPFWPIFDRAAQGDQNTAAKCFGLMVWEVFAKRPEKWGFGRYEFNGEPIAGMTYFRVDL